MEASLLFFSGLVNILIEGNPAVGSNGQDGIILEMDLNLASRFGPNSIPLGDFFSTLAGSAGSLPPFKISTPPITSETLPISWAANTEALNNRLTP